MQPFEGVRVLDLTHVLAGPFSTYQLAVFGADVVKIEGVGSFDMNREIGAVSKFNHEKMGTHFQSQAANKRAMTLNLKSEAGREVFLTLAREADVIVENFRTGAMDRLGLGYEDVKRVNAKIDYCSITGFGHTGPKREHAAFDNTIQAYSGLMAQNGAPDDAAVLIGPPVLDYATGLQAAFAIASALLRRERTGKGQHIDVAMLDSALMLMTSGVLNFNTTGKDPGRSRYSRRPYAAYGCYETADGEILAIGGVTPEHYRKIWTVLGRDDLAAAMAGLTTMDMAARAERDEPVIADIIAGETAARWEARFIEAGLPAARMRGLKDALESEQVQSRAVLGSFPSKVAKRGRLEPALAGFMTSEDGAAITAPPPDYDEHTHAILREAGYAPDAIERLAETGAIARRAEGAGAKG